MPAVTVRNIPPATHRAIKQRAIDHGISAEAEIRAILEEAVKPSQRLRLGTALFELRQRFGGVNLDISRDPTPTDAAEFE